MVLADRSSTDGQTRYALTILHAVSGRPLTAEVIDLHAAHLAELDRSGKLVLAGPVLERAGGLIVLRETALSEARAIMDSDPLIRGGYQTYDIGTWLMSNRDNNYRPALTGSHA